MRVLKIIHGYPPRYNAGSEVYSQTLCENLSKRHEVHVFTREENMFAHDGEIHQERDSNYPNLTLHVINAARTNINYKSAAIDRAFETTIRKILPDVVHIGHLNHLSLGILEIIGKLEIPIVYTLHDFWLLCMRGQFIQVEPSANEIWPLCDGQDDKKCAVSCFRRFAGDDSAPVINSENWVSARMAAARRVMELTDIFISPSRYLMERFCREAPQVAHKIDYLDYGFDLDRLSERKCNNNGRFVFGYIGTHIPGKGVHHLLEAFAMLNPALECELRIWGRESENTKYLKRMVEMFPESVRQRIFWQGEYQNNHIVEDVFNHIDAVVTPSIWMENSPLVIHEAQQLRIPVITADMGGMAEYVRHEKNGLLFKRRNSEDLSRQMTRLAADPDLAKRLGKQGYLYSDTGGVPDIMTHTLMVEEIYCRAIEKCNRAKVKVKSAPWRITFDTNPDHCNYQCTMCEEHSPYSPLQFQRSANKIKKRVMLFDIIAGNVERMAKHGLREIIPSTMGEPLLYKRFEDIIKLCARHDVKLNLTTNGSFPRLGAEKWGRLLVPVSSDIKISWNGATKETHEAIMKNAKWEDMLANIRTLAAARDSHAASGGNRCRLTFQMTFMEANYIEIPALIRLAASLGVDRVKGHHLWAHFSEIKEEDMRRNLEAVSRWNQIVDEAHAAARDYLLPGGRQVLLENINYLDEHSNSAAGACPFLGKEAWVSAVGRFDPCCAPDAERRTLGEFGNLHETDLMDIWNGETYQLLTKTYRSRAVCIKCNMRK